jgi:hypothetical protein
LDTAPRVGFSAGDPKSALARTLSMRLTENLRRQHQELAALAREIGRLLQPGKLASDGGPVRHLLALLAGTLRVHVAMEDESLYPRLLAHRDPGVRDKARRFLDEMGGIRIEFSEYLRAWPGPSAIQARPEEFVAATRRMFALLYERMQRENEELHPLADEIELN